MKSNGYSFSADALALLTSPFSLVHEGRYSSAISVKECALDYPGHIPLVLALEVTQSSSRAMQHEGRGDLSAGSKHRSSF